MLLYTLPWYKTTPHNLPMSLQRLIGGLNEKKQNNAQAFFFQTDLIVYECELLFFCPKYSTMSNTWTQEPCEYSALVIIWCATDDIVI